jgi:hypothetical protein
MWRGNYADLEFAREVIERVAGRGGGGRYGRDCVRKLSTSSLGFRFVTFEVGDRLINPPQFAASESDHRLSALGIGAGARGSVAVGTS